MVIGYYRQFLLKSMFATNNAAGLRQVWLPHSLITNNNLLCKTLNKLLLISDKF